MQLYLWHNLSALIEETKSFSYAFPLTLCLTIDHELRYNKNGLLRDHSMESHQSVMLQLLHQVGLLEEGLRLHRSLL